MSDQNAKVREAIERTAVKIREATGGKLTHTEAVDRARAARERGDKIRNDDRNR
jgi:hypothetical protein